MSLKSTIKRYVRGSVFLIRSFVLEKPRGLDFSLRQKTKGISMEGNHGYALTQKKSFQNIMDRLDINKDDNFIDIGCGKGGVLYYASMYPFKRIAGIEIEDELYEIAVKNFQRLNLTNIEIFHENAITYKNYNEFNVFFLFNPFEPDIYQKVIDNIFNTLNYKRNDSRVYLICYGATITEYIRNKQIMKLIDNYVDSVRGTNVNIWKWER